jgi:NitT/TauT family transport system substrate-binding protein
MRILIAFLLVLTAGPALAAGAANPPPVHITFVTDWKAQAEHGGFYEALAEGLYAKRGLDVKIPKAARM